eukprot:2118873-Prymnesium_polylepis.1
MAGVDGRGVRRAGRRQLHHQAPAQRGARRALGLRRAPPPAEARRLPPPVELERVYQDVRGGGGQDAAAPRRGDAAREPRGRPKGRDGRERDRVGGRRGRGGAVQAAAGRAGRVRGGPAP